MIRFNKIQTALSAALSGIIGLLGFQSCDSDNDEPVMYGTPYATFQISGKVTDPQGAPVRDARVIVRPQIDGIYQLYHDCDTVTTAADGSYNIDSRTTNENEMMRVVCQPHGKRLEADSTEISIDYRPVSDGNAWHTANGTATVDFTLPETPSEEKEPVTQ